MRSTIFLIICSLLILASACAYSQTHLPVSIGQTPAQAVKILQHYTSVTISASQRVFDSSGGWRNDSAYDGVLFHGIRGRLYVQFSRDAEPKITGLHWESGVKYQRALNILLALKKQYGGEVDTSSSPTWGIESPGIIREAIVWQRSLIYRESYSSQPGVKE